MAYVFVEVDKTLNGSHSGSSGSTRTTTSSSGSTDLRSWVKNILIIGDPIAVLNSGDTDFMPTLAQMYLEGDPDVVESLTDWYPELKPVVENYISSGSAAASTTTSSSHTIASSSTTTTTSSGSSHSGSSGTASTPGTHTTSSSVTTSSTGKDHTGATANTSSGSGHSGSSSTPSTPGTHTTSGSTSTPLDNLQNEYDEEAMRIYQEAMKESNNTSAAIDETPANYNTAQLERKQANYWPYILGGVAAVGLIYLLSRKKKNDKK